MSEQGSGRYPWDRSVEQGRVRGGAQAHSRQSRGEGTTERPSAQHDPSEPSYRRRSGSSCVLPLSSPKQPLIPITAATAHRDLLDLMDDEEPPARALSPQPAPGIFPQTTGGQSRIQPQGTGQSSFSQSALQGTIFPQATGPISPQTTGQPARALSPQSTGFANNFAALPAQQGTFFVSFSGTGREANVHAQPEPSSSPPDPTSSTTTTTQTRTLASPPTPRRSATSATSTRAPKRPSRSSQSSAGISKPRSRPRRRRSTSFTSSSLRRARRTRRNEGWSRIFRSGRASRRICSSALGPNSSLLRATSRLCASSGRRLRGTTLGTRRT